MDYLLDTNLILFYLRNETKVIDIVDTLYRPFATPNSALISIVSIAELKSLAMRNDWGYHRLSHMQLFLNELLRVDINSEDVFERYAEIDTFSQGKSKIKSLKDSARNMGKNDLWIAATASVLNIPLLTTDKDFNHLKDVYVTLHCVNRREVDNVGASHDLPLPKNSIHTINSKYSIVKSFFIKYNFNH